MAFFDGIMKILGSNGSATASVTNRGSKGAIGVEILDASGNQIVGFGGSSLINVVYDYVSLTYDGNGNATVIQFFSGGAVGALVATLTLTYDGSNNLLTVTKT